MKVNSRNRGAPRRSVGSTLRRTALRLWIKADASCGAVVSMLSKAREPRFFEIPDTVYRVWYPRLTFTHWGTRLCDCGEDDTSALDDVFAQNGHLHLIDGERVWSWLTSFTGYFGHVLAHNSPRGMCGTSS